mgnify:CR=1 FL=1
MAGREDVITTLRESLPDLSTQFGVESLSLFGSFARGEDRPDSDVDLLVEFSRPPTLFVLARLRNALSDLLRRPVDLGTPASLRPFLRDEVLGECIRVA